ncbi:hypothetical protein [Parabacteroides distasonis]|nr:hypothetical protein [Parabacteroides distasonis]
MKGDFISLEEGSLPLEKLLKEEEVFILILKLVEYEPKEKIICDFFTTER